MLYTASAIFPVGVVVSGGLLPDGPIAYVSKVAIVELCRMTSKSVTCWTALLWKTKQIYLRVFSFISSLHIKTAQDFHVLHIPRWHQEQTFQLLGHRCAQNSRVSHHTYLWPLLQTWINFHPSTVEACEMISNCIPHFTGMWLLIRARIKVKPC